MLFNEINYKIKLRIGVFEISRAITYNDLHVSDGRGTEAQNCKPITNLKEKTELSNYCKNSAYRLHAVSGSCFYYSAVHVISFSVIGLQSLSNCPNLLSDAGIVVI